MLFLTITFCILFFSACYTPEYKPEDTIIPPIDEQISNSICDEIINISISAESNTEGPFSIGDIIPESLLVESDYCYPADSLGRSFSFANHPNKVFMIEMSATWWGPCFDAIQDGDAIYEYWENNERADDVIILHFLDDIFNPTCIQWGNAGILGIPPIVDDGVANTVRGLFPPNPDPSATIYPITIFINHNMQIINIEYGSLNLKDTNLYINCMLDAM